MKQTARLTPLCQQASESTVSEVDKKVQIAYYDKLLTWAIYFLHVCTAPVVSEFSLDGHVFLLC
jgi:hypothetical protein